MSKRIAIIVAMKAEIAPLLRKIDESAAREAWLVHGLRRTSGGQAWLVQETVMFAGGIGRKAAAIATREVIERFQPDLIISAGFAGALRSEKNVGDVLRASRVIDASSGDKYECVRDSDSSGVLVTAATVLSRKGKEELAHKFGADAVDMEAAVVGEVAHASGIDFMSVKAISDELEFEMPPLGRFVDAHGQMQLLKLIAYAAFHPQIWRALGELRKNSRVAAEKLAGALEKIVSI